MVNFDELKNFCTTTAKRFFVKALHATAGSAPRARPAKAQVEEPTAVADPLTTTSAPRVITLDTTAAPPVEEPTAPADQNPTQSAPRVINVDKNAAYPKAIAELKAAGMLPEAVKLRQVKYLNNLIEQDHRAHQTVGQARDGLLFLRDGRTDAPRL
jgi:hypothetical protein